MGGNTMTLDDYQLEWEPLRFIALDLEVTTLKTSMKPASLAPTQPKSNGLP